MRRLRLSISFLLMSFLGAALFIYTRPQIDAQGRSTCPAVVENAITRIDSVCSGTRRNQVCYGHTRVRVLPREDLINFNFAPGDITALDNLRRINLAPLNATRNEWGISLMQLQANLPGTLPGQNVSVLLFGGVDMLPMPRVDSITPTRAATSAATSSSRSSAIADLHNSAWRRADWETQAFRISTGIGGARCDEITTDGVLIQSPDGVRWVTVSINGVDIRLGSTIFVTAVPGQRMRIFTLEGTAFIAVPDSLNIDTTLTVAVAGTVVDVPMSENLLPSGQPELPISYTEADVFGLPVDVLEQPVEPAPPADDDTLRVIIGALESGTLDVWVDERYTGGDNPGDDWWIEPGIIVDVIARADESDIVLGDIIDDLSVDETIISTPLPIGDTVDTVATVVDGVLETPLPTLPIGDLPTLVPTFVPTLSLPTLSLPTLPLPTLPLPTLPLPTLPPPTLPLPTLPLPTLPLPILPPPTVPAPTDTAAPPPSPTEAVTAVIKLPLR